MDLGSFFAFICGGLLNFCCWWNATQGTINEIGINPRFYPKHYITPSRWIKKMFNIPKKEIPRFLYYMCYATITYLFFGPIELALYSLGYVNFTAWVLLIHCCYVLLNAIMFLILSKVFKSKK